MSAKVTNSYTPTELFKRAEGLPSIVPEAINENTELWLIRLPANEIGQADLLEKNLKLKLSAADGKIGHFVSEKGQEYNIVKHRSVDVLRPYAIIPNESDTFVVRKIACQVGFVRSLNVRANEENSHMLEKGKADKHGTEHRQRRGSNPEQQSNYVTPVKQTSSVSDIAERPSKKKKRRTEVSERN